jgi:hypothetical protein
MKHSPAPWKIHIAGPNVWIMSGTDSVAFTGTKDKLFQYNDQRYTLGNAHMMSASIELYEALRWAIGKLSAQEYERFMSDPAHPARIAFNKAEGK